MAAIPEVPPMFSVAPDARIIPPVPERAVATVMVLFTVTTAGVVMVTFGTEKFPVRDWLFVKNVCKPAPEVKVPLFVMPLLKDGVIAALSVQLAPAFTITAPVKVFAGFVADENVSVPDVPLPMVVVPPTLSVNAPMVSPVPLLICKLPPIARFAPVEADAEPFRVKLPVIDVTAPIVFIPDPENVRLL